MPVELTEGPGRWSVADMFFLLAAKSRDVDVNQAVFNGKDQPREEKGDSRTMVERERETGRAVFFFGARTRKRFIVAHEGAERTHTLEWKNMLQVNKRLREYWEGEGKTVAGNEIADFQQALNDSQAKVDGLMVSHYATVQYCKVDTFRLIWILEPVGIRRTTYVGAGIVFANRKPQHEPKDVDLVGSEAFWDRIGRPVTPFHGILQYTSLQNSEEK